MKKLALCMVLIMGMHSLSAQKTSPSLRLKAYQRSYVSGVAPTPVVEVGGKETTPKAVIQEPEYLIYLLTYKVPYLKIERVWIKKHLYLASINKINSGPIIVVNGDKKDTLIKYTDETIWQVKITGKDKTGIKPKKDIEKQVKANELVLRLVDQNGHLYTRTAKQISDLEPIKGQ